MKPFFVYFKLVDQTETEYNACLIFKNTLSIRYKTIPDYTRLIHVMLLVSL